MILLDPQLSSVQRMTTLSRLGKLIVSSQGKIKIEPLKFKMTRRKISNSRLSQELKEHYCVFVCVRSTKLSRAPNLGLWAQIFKLFSQRSLGFFSVFYQLSEHTSSYRRSLKYFFLFRELNKFGIMTQHDYRKGNWHGNSTLSASQIYNSVTYNLSEILTSFSLIYEYEPDWLTFSGDFNDLNFKEIGLIHFGRCFEIDIKRKKKMEDIYKLKLIYKKSAMVYIILPWQLLFLYSKSKFQVNVGFKSFIDGNFI